MNVFDLAAKLTLDKSEYEKGLDTAEKDAGTFGSKFAGALGTAGKIGVGAITALGTATAAAGKMLVDNAGQVAEYGDSIDKMSQKIGISAEAYQEWDFIAQHSGTSMESLKTSFKTLATQAQSGSKEFEQLGLSLEDVQKMSTEDLFKAVVNGLQNMEEGTERTALASKLLGRGAIELGALLNTSAEDTEAMRKQVHDLGGVMSNDGVKASARYQDSLQNMQTSMAGLKNNLMGNFLPGIADVMDGLALLFSGDSSGMQAVNQGIDTIVTTIADGMPKVLEIGGKIVESLAQAIMENLPKIVESASGVILTLVQSLISGLPDILQAGIQIIGSLVDGLADALPDLIPAAVDAIITIAENLVDNIDKIIDAAGKIILALGEGLIKALPKLVASLPKIVMAILNGIGKVLSQILKMGGDIISNLWTGIKNGIGKLGEVIANVAKTIVNGIMSLPKMILDKAKEIISNLGQGIRDGIPKLGEVLGNVGKAIIGALSAIPKAVFDIGVMVIQGFIDGVGSLVDNAVKGVTGFFGGIVDGVAHFLGIASPSKVFAQFGQYSAEGFGIGFDKEFDSVKSDIENSMQFDAQDIPVGDITYTTASANSTNALLNNLINAVNGMNGQQIVLDTGVLVGQTVSKMDSALGNLANKNARSVLA